jgi:hypothetical protein
MVALHTPLMQKYQQDDSEEQNEKRDPEMAVCKDGFKQVLARSQL